MRPSSTWQELLGMARSLLTSARHARVFFVKLGKLGENAVKGSESIEKDPPSPGKALTVRANALIHYRGAEDRTTACGGVIGTVSQDRLATRCKACWRELEARGLVPTKHRTKEIARLELTEGLSDSLLTAVRGGATIESAAALYDVPPNMIFAWLEVGARLLSSEALYLTDQEDRLRAFCLAVRAALARFEVDLVENIRRAGNMAKHWQANAWLLEKRIPKTYGKKSEVEVKQTLTANELDLSKLSDDKLRELQALLEQASGLDQASASDAQASEARDDSDLLEYGASV